MVVSFSVQGKPVPKGRPRVTQHGTYTPKSTQAFESSVRRAWLESGGYKFQQGAPIAVYVRAYFPIPKRKSKKARAALDSKPYLAARGDIDNIVKAVMDALNGFAYQDDSVVFAINAEKRYSDCGRTFVVLSDEVT